jgi:hypothetical protein
VDGAEIDLAHHGPDGWGAGVAIGERAALLCHVGGDRRGDGGQAPPAAIIRAHYHDYRHETVRVMSGETEHVCEAVILPSYCG